MSKISEVSRLPRKYGVRVNTTSEYTNTCLINSIIHDHSCKIHFLTAGIDTTYIQRFGSGECFSACYELEEDIQ